MYKKTFRTPNIKSKEVKKFVDMVKLECFAHNVELKLNPVKYLRVTPNIRCAGYFTADSCKTFKRELSVAMNSSDWLHILVHEYAHLTQWAENIPLWKEADPSVVALDEWLGGKRKAHINYHIDIVKYLELDNEIRSAKLIKKWKLPIDVSDYIRRANSYIQYYNWIKESRKWLSGDNAPYANNRIVAAMSDKFNMKYDEMSPKIRKIFYEETGI